MLRDFETELKDILKTEKGSKIRTDRALQNRFQNYTKWWNEMLWELNL